MIIFNNIEFLLKGCLVPSGKVKFFNEEEGYGIITSNYDNEELFVHYSEYRNASIGKQKLEVGDEVTYNIAFTDKGLEAINVHLKKPIAV